jgi:hypothetical protein
MMQPPPAPMVQPPTADMAGPTPLENPQESYFYDSLAPYGSWVQVVDIGWCWQPMVASVDASWLPYRDRGHWILTDEGWYWASDYNWGWAAFHYGRWSHHDKYGWIWSPGSVWAPAWVAWRDSDTYAGWAPLPPNAFFDPDAGLFAGWGPSGIDESFGLSASWFTFVTYEHFTSPKVSGYAASAAQSQGLFKNTKPVNNYSASGRKVVNSGVSPGLVAAATKTPVRKFSLDAALSPDTSGARVHGTGLAVFRPDLSASGARVSANAEAQPVRINKPAPGQAATPVQTAPPGSQEATFRSGFAPGNFQPSPKRINAPADVSAPVGGRSYSSGNMDAGRLPRASDSATTPPGQRGYNPGPSAAPPFTGPPRNAPGYPPPQRPEPLPQRPEPSYTPAPSVPNETRGGGVEVYPTYPYQPASSAASGPTSTGSKSSNK